MNIMSFIKRYKGVIIVVGVLLVLNAFFLYASPREIVEQIGVENSYLVVFLIAAIGGVSTLTGTALYAAIATFAAGGATPWILGLVGGIGIFISNSIFFALALYGRKSVSDEMREKLERITARIEGKISRKAVLALAYVYLSFSPLSDDILMIALVIAEYPYRKVAPVLFAGGITLATLVAYLGNIWG